MVQRPQQVGGEDVAALEDGDDQQIVVARLRDLAGNLAIARRDRFRIEQNADRSPPDARHQRIPMIWFSRSASFSVTWVASAGGVETALRNPNESPGPSPALVGSTSQE